MNILKKIKNEMKQNKTAEMSFNDLENKAEYDALKKLGKSEFKKEKYTLKLYFQPGICSGMVDEPNKVRIVALHNF